MDSDEDHRTPAPRLAYWLPILASALFVMSGLGMTCAEWNELPQGGFSPTYRAYGSWDGGLWAVDYRGYAQYRAIYQGYWDSEQNVLRQWDYWYLDYVQLATQGSFDQLDILIPQGFHFMMGGSVDLYSYNAGQEDWLEIEHRQGANRACGVKMWGGNWLTLCGIGDIHRFAHQPYGIFRLAFSVDPEMGICAGGCTADWTHRIP